MELDDIIKELGKKALQEKLGVNTADCVCDPLMGKYVIVRSYSAGVFAGTLKARLPDKRVALENCRRLWRWHTANNGVSLSEVAVHGIEPKDSKICCVESYKEVEPIEMSPATDKSRKSIEGAKDYVA